MKKHIRMSVKGTLNFCGAIFALVGLIFLIAGIVTTISDINFRNNAEQTQGEIINIERESYRSHGKNRTHHYVTIGYTVDGEYYEREFSQYNSGMYVGKELTVYYDSDDPGNVKIFSPVFQIVFIGMGGLFFVLGMTFIMVNVVSAKRVKALIENGDVLTGTIINVKMNTSMRINGKHPYKAECEVIDPYSGEKYLYSSKNIMEDISGLIGSEVTVYADKNDRSKYYVNINELLERYNRENNIHDYR